jgi:hypothetical protein
MRYGPLPRVQIFETLQLKRQWTGFSWIQILSPNGSAYPVSSTYPTPEMGFPS